MTDFNKFKVPDRVNNKYKKPVAYFCMEFGIDQALKIYSGGLGYLAGSHMRSAYDLKQNLIGIGILWKYGYYDQERSADNQMAANFREKFYSFLQETGIKFTITIDKHDVWVKAMYLAPEVFGTAPLFFLSTEVPENDWLSHTIVHKLYDNNPSTKIAQNMLLGIGGVKLLEALHWEPEVYHMNEAHALSGAFYLYEKWENIDKVKEKFVFTTHTPVPAGNEVHDINLLDGMSFFGNLPLEEVKKVSEEHGNAFNHSLAALRMSHKANGVSKIHGEVAREMWGSYPHIAPITHVTNSQNWKYWADPELNTALEKNKDKEFKSRKNEMKKRLFEIVADQNGKLFKEDVITIVWARRFADYKRADLITRDKERFLKILNNSKYPVQIIWAGKPYPTDFHAVSTFNSLVNLSKNHPNLAVLTGYELALSKALKQGSDVWLNNPRIPREASGTSGMTAAMNGSVNFSTHDGWIPEFSHHGINCYTLPPADPAWPIQEQDRFDLENLYRILEDEILPTYYDKPKQWLEVVKQSMTDIKPFFDSDRMATEYYEKMYE
ncbi:MAG: alpha-glucan family phosphorylase [Saprospiraceae bacterium]|nr:alpha-glucan family phosphorylase [Saprospiraceae bacterium]